MRPYLLRLCEVFWVVLLVAGPLDVQAQQAPFDPSWYDPARTYVKVAVVEDGIYRVTGEELTRLGIAPSTIDPGTVRLFANGREVPLWYEGPLTGIDNDARFLFVGRRNSGAGEAWAYRDNPDWQSGTHFSLYTDTTFYWLTWGRQPGLRYREGTAPSQTFPDVSVFRDTLHLEQDAQYFSGREEENPFYTRGEGYYWHSVLNHRGNVPSRTWSFGTPLPHLALADARRDTVYFTTRLAGRSIHAHRVAIEVSGNPRNPDFKQYGQVAWNGYQLATLRGAVPEEAITGLRGNQVDINLISYNDANSDINTILTDWIEISYVRTMTAANNALRFSFAETGGRQLRLNGFADGPVYVFNPHDERVFLPTATQGALTFADSPSVPPRYWAAGASAVKTPAGLAVDRGSDLASPVHEADYVIVTTRPLRASAEALAEYRRVQNGYKVIVVDVQDVFDQFDYGRPTPLALRRFARQTQAWRLPPRFLVLWGDALYANRTRTRKDWEVPSYGIASSDAWIAMQKDGPDDWTEFIAIGRIPIRTNETGLTFLQKLQAYEATPLQDWQKRMLLLVGGRDSTEQHDLQRRVIPWGNRAAAAPSGMETQNFFSFTNDQFGIEASLQDSLRRAFRQGGSWITYFGHSSSDKWDIVIDPPEDFGNADRLPIAISLGCRTGAFARGTGSANDLQALSELLVVSSLNGSIAHWGTSGLGSVSASTDMGNILHALVFSDTMRVFGPTFREVKRRYVEGGNFSLRDLVQFGLIGDPATRLNLPVLADFHVVPELIRITPAAPVPSDETIQVALTLRNRGLVPADSVTVELLQILPDGAAATYRQRVPPFRQTTDVVFDVPISEAVVGRHTFRVQADPDDVVPEVDELNNTGEQTHIVFSSELSLIAPLAMSAVASTQPTLRVTFVAQDDRPVTGVRFELDTVPTFDSPALRTFRTETSGTFAVWTLDAPLAPNQVYHWRARLETDDGLENWKTSAFYVEEGGSGNSWLQVGSLFQANTHDHRLGWQDGRWAFEKYAVEVQFTASNNGPFLGQFVVNGVRYERRTLGFGVLILDGLTGAVRAFGSVAPYRTSTANAVEQLTALLEQARPDDYLFVRTRHVSAQSGDVIPDEVRELFSAYGSAAIDTLTYDDLWLLRARVGHRQETREWVEPNPASDLFDLVETEVLRFPFSEGQTTTPAIGPARAWESLTWSRELPNETSALHIAVLDAETGTVLLDSLDAPGTVDLSGLDVQAHPRLQLRATFSDTTHRATPQLTQWRVRFTATPELAADAITVSADSLLEGDTVTITGSVVNLSDVAAEDVAMRLFLTDSANSTRLVAADTLASVAPSETATASFTLETEGLAGRNELRLEVEQIGLAEAFTFNNISFGSFSVGTDRTPPVLEVTVDGVAYPHEPDPPADLQSPDILVVPLQPTIEIVLRDENPFKLLTDTALVAVWLDDARIGFDEPELRFEPATATRNEARIVYTPDFTGQDGVFRLRVEASDVAENTAEGSPYQLHFRVESAFGIGSVYPYPNPMNSFTRFAFRIQGADPTVIDEFRLRIYTLTGRVVQEFDLVEDPALLDGGLRIGWNQLVWDGRDFDGDLLATGVYLYKVFLKVEGQPLEVNENPIEKIVIVR